MPYNTRRKSLSLPSLGIHVPVTHAARAAAQRASPNQAAHPNGRGASPTSPVSSHRHSASTSSASPSTPATNSSTSADASAHRPNKRVKRCHDEAHSSTNSASSSSSKLPAGANIVTTPPPSPKPVRHASVDMTDAASDAGNPANLAPHDVNIDMEAVKDDIVEAIILELMAAGNRPHLVKELSALLMPQLKSVQQSANPCAIISSRLASYMKRPCWSASVPCPLAKELESVHPRRTYYFITTYPHLPIPDASSSAFIAPRTSISIVTPPLSNAASGTESVEEERRRELSPSPEVDLSSPEFDDLDDEIPMPGTPIGSFSVRFPHITSGYNSRSHRGASPPLEKDEKEFTQTAEGLQKRKLAGNSFLLTPSPDASAVQSIEGDDAGREESPFFPTDSGHLFVTQTTMLHMTSPAMRPTSALGMKKEPESENWAKLDNMLEWDRCPESMELEELDGLLDGF